MGLGVVVVEGAQYSGSLITARLAMEFGREVFGVPGNATQAVSFGPNQLIKQGAKLVTGWEDVVEELPTPVRAELMPVESASARRARRPGRGGPGAPGAAFIWAFERGRGPPRRRFGRKFRASAPPKCWRPYLTWSSKAWYASYLESNS